MSRVMQWLSDEEIRKRKAAQAAKRKPRSPKSDQQRWEAFHIAFILLLLISATAIMLTAIQMYNTTP